MRPLWSAALLAASSIKAFVLPTPSLPRPRCTPSTSAFLSSSKATMSSGSSSSGGNIDSLERAKRRISEAISIGAPAYNAGDIEGCASVYRDAAKEIAPLLPAALQTKLLQEVNDANENENENETNHDAKAWALRRVFDAIMDYQLPILPGDVAGESIAFEPFTASQLGGEPVGVMDSVMGGVSRGGWVATSNTFFGETSLANNGGFASIRWRFPIAQNWSYANGLYIKGLRHSKADEHTFRIILKDDMCERVRLANYKVIFDQPLLIPFSAFNQMEQMGRPTAGSPAFNKMRVTEIGLMAIKPTVVGEFQMEFSEWGLYA